MEETHLSHDHEEREERLARDRERKRKARRDQRGAEAFTKKAKYASKICIPTADQKLLRQFRNTMNNLKNNLSETCNERFPSIMLSAVVVMLENDPKTMWIQVVYKDGRFARHRRWRYFALNSLMRRRASSEGRVFVRQNLEEEQLTVADTGFNAKQYSHSKVLRIACADVHWQDLHNLMPNGKNSVNTETVHEAAKRQRKDLKLGNGNRCKSGAKKKWQHHGSVQVHGIAKRKEAPEIDWEKMKNNDEIKEELQQSIPTCMHLLLIELIDKWLHYLELTTARNDPLINPHDRIQLQRWRANVDLIPILTTQYVSKYASEAEPRSLGSLAFSEVLDKAHRNDDPNDPAVKAFQSCSFTQSENVNQQLRDSNENVPNNENNGIL
ncbi:hypothetical protein RhiirA4_484248 [Rhizophagus irregularis]|uniref:Uncharacterized protein n=1 Tax=Rhizophagus irregularis TaxID=588596 RepID=A0A2I1HNQ4_9GLOM|nr:hypothetical protein RhiirA4_484248 [Rhizophagus irregularis]